MTTASTTSAAMNPFEYPPRRPHNPSLTRLRPQVSALRAGKSLEEAVRHVPSSPHSHRTSQRHGCPGSSASVDHLLGAEHPQDGNLRDLSGCARGVTCLHLTAPQKARPSSKGNDPTLDRGGAARRGRSDRSPSEAVDRGGRRAPTLPAPDPSNPETVAGARSAPVRLELARRCGMSPVEVACGRSPWHSGH
jgi:hypothetical protein